MLAAGRALPTCTNQKTKKPVDVEVAGFSARLRWLSDRCIRVAQPIKSELTARIAMIWQSCLRMQAAPSRVRGPVLKLSDTAEFRGTPIRSEEVTQSTVGIVHDEGVRLPPAAVEQFTVQRDAQFVQTCVVIVLYERDVTFEVGPSADPFEVSSSVERVARPQHRELVRECGTSSVDPDSRTAHHDSPHRAARATPGGADTLRASTPGNLREEWHSERRIALASSVAPRNRRTHNTHAPFRAVYFDRCLSEKKTGCGGGI